MLGAAVLAVLGTLLSGSEPGFLLGLFVILSSVIAALTIRRRAVYLLIPLPALLLFLTAVLTGAVKDSATDTSRTALGVNFLQWIADVFFPICAATILVLVIAAGRWLLSRQFVAGHFQASAGADRARTAPGPRADRERRSAQDSDPWGAVAALDDRSQPGGPRGRRDPGDPWGDRRQPPGGGSRPGDRPVPPGRALPPERTLPPDRGQRGQRGQPDGRDPRGTGNPRANRDQRDPRDPWGQRLVH